MCNNQIIATIYEMMKFNKVSLEELIEFIDNQKKSYTTYSYDKTKKWGDEEVELDFIEAQQTAEEQVEEQVAEPVEEQVAEQVAEQVEEKVAEQVEEQVAEQVEEQVAEQVAEQIEEKVEEKQENTTSWVSVIKKSKIIRSEIVKNPQIVKKSQIIKSQVVKQKVVKSQVVKQQPKKKDERFVIYTVHEFIQCIKNKQKLHIDFTIDPESHCEHTFNGTICDNVKECGKIHVQRCMNNLDCQYKYCQFLHVDEMPDEEAKENYMDSMDEYNRIKKNKKVYV